MTRNEAEKIVNKIGIGFFEDAIEEQQNYDELINALIKADAEGYERARKDLTAIHGAKWQKEDFNKGYQRGIEEGDQENMNRAVEHYRTIRLAQSALAQKTGEK